MAEQKGSTSRKKKAASSKSTALERDFRKANDSIGLVVVEGKLSLLSRKLYNAMIISAQELGEPGNNAPIKTTAAEQYFWVRAAELVRDADFNSKDFALIKESLEDLQNVKVKIEDDREWTSERLVSGVKIVNTSGLASRGGTLWLGFAFPPEVSQLVLKPNTYTKISLYYSTQLRSGYSHALYEYTRRYATSPSHLTARLPWQRVYGMVSGSPLPQKIPEYKYFKRDMLKSSIAEINAVTDIEIELVEFKEGRSVVDLQFKVYQKQQTAIEMDTPIIDLRILGRMKALGIQEDEAGKIYVDNDESLLVATLDLVEKRLKSSHKKLESPAAYFKKALAEKYAKAAPGPAPSASPPPAVNGTLAVAKKREKPTVRERYIVARSRQAFKYYEAMGAGEQAELLGQFKSECDAAVKNVLTKRGLDAELAKRAFSEWLAYKWYGDPTDAQLVAFADSEVIDMSA